MNKEQETEPSVVNLEVEEAGVSELMAFYEEVEVIYAQASACSSEAMYTYVSDATGT